MTLNDALARLESLAHPSVLNVSVRSGATDNQYGVKLGDIRTVAKECRADHALGLQLWRTGNLDAMLLSTLVMSPKQLSADELAAMTASVTCEQLAEWLISYVVKQHPEKEALRVPWMASDNPWVARAGWSLTAERIVKDPVGLDPAALLDRLEAEMGAAPAPTQWTMNFALAETGIRFPELRDRAIAIGERLGLYRDYPVSKGCTSPFAPIWIAEMVRRQAGS